MAEILAREIREAELRVAARFPKEVRVDLGCDGLGALDEAAAAGLSKRSSTFAVFTFVRLPCGAST